MHLIAGEADAFFDLVVSRHLDDVLPDVRLVAAQKAERYGAVPILKHNFLMFVHLIDSWLQVFADPLMDDLNTIHVYRLIYWGDVPRYFEYVGFTSLTIQSLTHMRKFAREFYDLSANLGGAEKCSRMQIILLVDEYLRCAGLGVSPTTPISIARRELIYSHVHPSEIVRRYADQFSAKELISFRDFAVTRRDTFQKLDLDGGVSRNTIVDQIEDYMQYQKDKELNPLWSVGGMLNARRGIIDPGGPESNVGLFDIDTQGGEAAALKIIAVLQLLLDFAEAYAKKHAASAFFSRTKQAALLEIINRLDGRLVLFKHDHLWIKADAEALKSTPELQIAAHDALSLSHFYQDTLDTSREYLQDLVALSERIVERLRINDPGARFTLMQLPQRTLSVVKERLRVLEMANENPALFREMAPLWIAIYEQQNSTVRRHLQATIAISDTALHALIYFARVQESVAIMAGESTDTLDNILEELDARFRIRVAFKKEQFHRMADAFTAALQEDL